MAKCKVLTGSAVKGLILYASFICVSSVVTGTTVSNLITDEVTFNISLSNEQLEVNATQVTAITLGEYMYTVFHKNTVDFLLQSAKLQTILL